jgi:hypothetical protein
VGPNRLRGENLMGLNAKGRKIVQCGIELLNIKEALSDLSNGELTSLQRAQLATLSGEKSIC